MRIIAVRSEIRLNKYETNRKNAMKEIQNRKRSVQNILKRTKLQTLSVGTKFPPKSALVALNIFILNQIGSCGFKYFLYSNIDIKLNWFSWPSIFLY